MRQNGIIRKNGMKKITSKKVGDSMRVQVTRSEASALNADKLLRLEGLAKEVFRGRANPTDQKTSPDPT